MKIIIYISLLIIMLTSCKDHKDEIEPIIDWEKELFGIGEFGMDKDSLESLLIFFSIHDKQPKRLKRLYHFRPQINEDTIIFPNISLSSFLWEKENFMNFRFDSSTYVMSSLDSLIQFDKVSGNPSVPSKLYLKKISNQFPENFQYQFADGWDAIDHYEFEIIRDDSFTVVLRGSPYEPYLFEVSELDSLDRLFIDSYLNLVTQNRYDTTDYRGHGAIYCGVSLDEKMVYNDSVFEYSTYVHRSPNARVLIDYFRSKVDSTQHLIDDYDMDFPQSKPKEFENLPKAIERAWIPPPVEEITEEAK